MRSPCRLLLLLLGCCGAAASSHYSVLGVGKRASSAEIKAAFRKLALEHHPDKQKDSKSDEMFKRLTEAYETLSDPERRRRYDMQQTFGGGSSAGYEHQQRPGGFGGNPYEFRFGAPGFGGVDGASAFFRPRPAVPPPRACRPFYCSLRELSDGCQREYTLSDSPWSRLRDAVSDGFKGPAGEALWRTASIAASIVWRFPRLCFGRRCWYIRLPALAIAFVSALAQQLPKSPQGKFAFDVKAGWRPGTRVVFAANDERARPVAFELRERRHPCIRRQGSSDLLWHGRISFTRAMRGTTLSVKDVHGVAHDVTLRLTREELAERRETVLRQVGDGLGLPDRKKKAPKQHSEGEARGELWAEVTLVGLPHPDAPELQDADHAEDSAPDAQ